ncbi:MAG TPA: hypothetical protein DIV86_03705 [Alphaproteobacteria bacterium]|nr:hypothetical protein [Alphaproteobacteria bacterium]
MSDKNLNVWVITNGTHGDDNQCIGVAEALSKNIKVIDKSIFGNLPIIRKFTESNFNSKLILPEGIPDVIIGSGTLTSEIALQIKRFFDSKPVAVSINDPIKNRKYFNLITVPNYKPTTLFENFISTDGVPHRIIKENLANEQLPIDIKNFLKNKGKPFIAVLVGGSTIADNFTDEEKERRIANGYGYFLEDHASEFSLKLNDLAREFGCTLIITNSRRTKLEPSRRLFFDIEEGYFHDYGFEKNPYLSLLAEARAIVVTGDSMSMICEACSAEKPVFIYEQNDQKRFYPNNYKILHHSLYEAGIAKPLDSINRLEWKPEGKAINSATQIANKIRELIEKREISQEKKYISRKPKKSVVIPETTMKVCNTENCATIEFTQEGLNNLGEKYRQVRGVPKFIHDFIHLDYKSPYIAILEKKPELFSWSETGDFLILPNLPYIDLNKALNNPKELVNLPQGFATIAWYIHPQILSGTVFSDIRIRENIELAIPHINYKPEVVGHNEYERLLNLPTIQEIEKSTEVPYLCSILDLKQEHIPLLKEVKNRLLKDLVNNYGVTEKDEVEISIHFPYKESTTTFHIHARINGVEHPLNHDKTFDFEKVIDHLEQGKNIDELILKKKIYHSSIGRPQSLSFLTDIKGVNVEIAKNPYLLERSRVRYNPTGQLKYYHFANSAFKNQARPALFNNFH